MHKSHVSACRVSPRKPAAGGCHVPTHYFLNTPTHPPHLHRHASFSTRPVISPSTCSPCVLPRLLAPTTPSRSGITHPHPGHARPRPPPTLRDVAAQSVVYNHAWQLLRSNASSVSREVVVTPEQGPIMAHNFSHACRQSAIHLQYPSYLILLGKLFNAMPDGLLLLACVYSQEEVTL